MSRIVRLLKQLSSNQKGQALAIVLALLAIGGLTIAVNLNYATTSLKGNGIVREKIEGVYAAGAGVEYVLWSLQKGWFPTIDVLTDNTTAEEINGMAVSMQTVNKGIFTLSAGELSGEVATHYDRLGVDGGAEVVGEDIIYTITLTRLEDFTIEISLNEVGATLPHGYQYVPGSTSGNFSLHQQNSVPPYPSDPSSMGTTHAGAQWLKWEWSQRRPSIPPGENMMVTHSFRITGTGGLEDDYAWAWSQTGNIGLVGEITGTLFKITSRAIRPQDNRTISEIVADIMIVGGTTYINSWQITQ